MVEDNGFNRIRGSIENTPEKKATKIKDADYGVSPEDLKKDRYKKDTAHRQRLVITVMIIIIGWLLAVMTLLFFCLFRTGLSDAVLIALLGTTTVNVLGLAAIVLKGFFHHMNQDIEFDEKKYPHK